MARARRITALRALELLRDLDENRHYWTNVYWPIDAVRTALANHVRAEITRKRRAARRRA